MYSRKISTFFISFVLVLVALVLLTGCGNENWGFGNYNFTHVHVSDTVEGYCATVKSWHDNESGIELHTEEFGNVYLSEGSYMLFEYANGCPYCGE